jgi:hypothetical protein
MYHNYHHHSMLRNSFVSTSHNAIISTTKIWTPQHRTHTFLDRWMRPFDWMDRSLGILSTISTGSRNSSSLSINQPQPSPQRRKKKSVPKKKKKPSNGTSRLNKIKKKRKKHIMNLLIEQALEEDEEDDAEIKIELEPLQQQLPILTSHERYEIIPKPVFFSTQLKVGGGKVRSRNQLTLQERIQIELYRHQQVRLAQKNPLHQQCRTCPICRQEFMGKDGIQPRNEMLHHLFHFDACTKHLSLELAQALLLQHRLDVQHGRKPEVVIFKKPSPPPPPPKDVVHPYPFPIFQHVKIVKPR